MADILNQNFASDDEEEDDFNPAPATGSDDEGNGEPERSGRSKLPRKPSTPEDQSDEIKEDDEAPIQSRRNGAAENPVAGDEEEEEDDEGGVQRTHTRDDNDDLDNEDAEEDAEDEEEEDEDEAVTVRHSTMVT